MSHANILVVATTLLIAAVACSAAATPPREGKYCSRDTHKLFSVVADPTDCSRYFRCLDNKYYAMECGGGLLFDKEESYCDYSENVKCETSMYCTYGWLEKSVEFYSCIQRHVSSWTLYAPKSVDEFTDFPGR